MLAQYLNHLAQKKTIDQLQKIVTSKEAIIGTATALVVLTGVSAYNSNKVQSCFNYI